MNSLAVILGFQISVSIIEILIFQIGAIILGFSIHFFWTSSKNPPPSNAERPVLAGSSLNPGNEWRLKYVEECEARQKLEKQIRRDLEMSRDNESLLVIELEEAKKEIDRLTELVKPPAEEGDDKQAVTYLDQLYVAHNHLHEHNQHISKLLGQIELLKESERKHLNTQKVNEELHNSLHELRKNLFEKENELRMVRQQQSLTREIQERLDRAYSDFNGLQENISRLKTYIAKPENRTYEYEELQQSFYRLTTEFDTLKLRQQGMLEENQRLSILMADAEDKLREANFHRQQLQKKLTFLDEMNRDLQQLTEQNKKLDNQLRRVTDIGNMMDRKD
jgi:DNA repair exonuclease SbcCD ATPase subunit